MTIASPSPPVDAVPLSNSRPIRPKVRALGLDATVRQILNRRPAVGLALGVIRDGQLSFFASKTLFSR